MEKASLIRQSVIVLILLVGFSTAEAAPILEIQNGVLVGARGVEVLGRSYDVSFKDGSCDSLFNGCDNDAFVFRDFDSGWAAASALLSQVFLDIAGYDLDSSPQLTNGCYLPDLCRVLTPIIFVQHPGFQELTFFFSENYASGSLSNDPDFVEQYYSSFKPDTTAADGRTFAVWTPIPEPGTLTLTGIGLLALGLSSRYRNR